MGICTMGEGLYFCNLCANYQAVWKYNATRGQCCTTHRSLSRCHSRDTFIPPSGGDRQRRWRLEVVFNRPQLVVEAVEWDLDPRYLVVDQVWDLELRREGWDPLRAHRITFTAPQCLGLDTRWGTNSQRLFSWLAAYVNYSVACKNKAFALWRLAGGQGHTFEYTEGPWAS